MHFIVNVFIKIRNRVKKVAKFVTFLFFLSLIIKFFHTYKYGK